MMTIMMILMMVVVVALLLLLLLLPQMPRIWHAKKRSSCNKFWPFQSENPGPLLVHSLLTPPPQGQNQEYVVGGKERGD